MKRLGQLTVGQSKPTHPSNSRSPSQTLGTYQLLVFFLVLTACQFSPLGRPNVVVRLRSSRMDTAAPDSAPSLLLALPDPLLLAVLHCLAAADDHRCLFSAARANSRLHRAALQVLSSITAVVKTIQQEYSLLRYLRKHDRHISSVSLSATAPHRGGLPPYYIDFSGMHLYTLRGLPPMQLGSLQLRNFTLQLLPVDGVQGVLAAAGLPGSTSALTRLQLQDCVLIDSVEELAAALAQLPGLEHLSMVGVRHTDRIITFPVDALQQLQQLQQLSYLEIASSDGIQVRLYAPQGIQPLQGLQALTRLVDLRLHVAAGCGRCKLAASYLAGAQHLTRLELGDGGVTFEPGVLSGSTQLRHLSLSCNLPEGAGGVPLLLSQLEPLEQLTHLSLQGSMRSLAGANQGPIPAAAFSALTTSSKLRHLDLSGCVLPAGVWQHIFPAGRQLLQLTYLNLTFILQPPWVAAAAPAGSLLVACCPNLQSLNMQDLQYSAESLAPLQQLTGLHTLLLASCTAESFSQDALRALCRLTGLRQLFCPPMDPPIMLTQLSRLQCLTELQIVDVDEPTVCFGGSDQAPGDEPVWRQLLQHYQGGDDPFERHEHVEGPNH